MIALDDSVLEGRKDTVRFRAWSVFVEVGCPDVIRLRHV
jgi:hypothetical protein